MTSQVAGYEVCSACLLVMFFFDKFVCVFLLSTLAKQLGKLTIRVLKVKQSLFISVYASPLVIDWKLRKKPYKQKPYRKKAL